MRIATPSSLGVEVRKKRTSLKLTLEQTALVSGVSMSFVRSLERGKESCQLAPILKVLTALGMTLDVEGAIEQTDVAVARHGADKK
jgi:transcriptional regulator with XRE-family HTH domain